MNAATRSATSLARQRVVLQAVLVGIGLALIVGAAAYFRFLGLDWDGDQHLHPDERFLCFVETGIQPVSSLREYFDTFHSPLNPNNRGYGFYVYGHFPIILVRYLAAWFALPGNHVDARLFGLDLGPDYRTVGLIGRGMSAVCDLLSTLMVFLIARRLHGRSVGLLAAALYAAAVLPIQQAHFFTVDACANVFVVVAFWAALRATEVARWSDDILFGMALGLGMASKISVFPLGLIMALALILRVVTHVSGAVRGSAFLSPLWRNPEVRDSLLRAAADLNAAALTTLLAFRIAQPYAFLPAHAGTPLPPDSDVVTRVLAVTLDVVSPRLNPAWRQQMEEVGRLMSGDDDQPPNHQWATRAPLVFPWLNMVRFGMGWPLGLTAWFGWAYALVRVGRGSPGWRRHVLPAAWIGGFFAWQGRRWVKSMRYLLPIYPILIVTAAWLLIRVARRTRVPEARNVLVRCSVAGAGALVVGTIVATTYAWAFAFTRIYTRPVTRVAASEWIYEHVPSDVTLTLSTPRGRYTYQIGLPNNWTPLNARADDPVAPAVSSTYLEADQIQGASFVLPRSGRLVRLTLTHVLDPTYQGKEQKLRVGIAEGPTFNGALTEGVLTASFPGSGGRGATYDVELSPVDLESGRTYHLVLSALSSPLVMSAATIATEGSWDDSVPLRLAGYEPWTVQYQEYRLEMIWEDTPEKRARLQYVLEHADYLVISSNRFYASLSRNPRRWPMTINYYRALFSGQLGFKLIGDFASPPTLGTWESDDQSAEEAFTVYDHPRVLVFEKIPEFSAVATAAVLGRASLDKVVRQRADQVIDRPVVLHPPRLPRE